MSYVVGTGMAAFCHGEDHPRSVPVAPGGMPARFAPEGSFTQPGALLVSREALRAGHRGVGGRNQHHLPARPLAASGQFPLGRADRGVGGLACHRGLGQEQRPEVRNGDHLVAGHDPPGPDAGRVGVLPGGLLVQLRRLAPGPPVSAGGGLPVRAPPAGLVRWALASSAAITPVPTGVMAPLPRPRWLAFLLSGDRRFARSRPPDPASLRPRVGCQAALTWREVRGGAARSARSGRPARLGFWPGPALRACFRPGTA